MVTRYLLLGAFGCNAPGRRILAFHLDRLPNVRDILRRSVVEYATAPLTVRRTSLEARVTKAEDEVLRCECAHCQRILSAIASTVHAPFHLSPPSRLR